MHKQLYRATGLGREQRRRENEKLRERLGWVEYMSYWRKADSQRTARTNRGAARRYYAQHREQILAKRRARRAAQKALAKVRSQ